jgi:S-formylglutathione hydrolase FrmB
MRSPLALLLVLACIAAALVAPSAASAYNPLSEGSFDSKALNDTIHYGVYLPPSYDSSPDKRYPVIYFLHGLTCNYICYRQIWWLGEAMEQSGREAIIIGAQGNRPGDEFQQWMNHGPGENWETATATELVNVVDSRYRTIASREGRAIVGASAGGYGAALIGFHRPGQYSVIQSWSGYFQPIDISGQNVIDLGTKSANLRASVPTFVPKLKKRAGGLWSRTYFDHYVGVDDDRFRTPNEKMHRQLARARMPHSAFRVYPGNHGVDLWVEHAPEWIALATKQLAPAQ